MSPPGITAGSYNGITWGFGPQNRVSTTLPAAKGTRLSPVRDMCPLDNPHKGDILRMIDRRYFQGFASEMQRSNIKPRRSYLRNRLGLAYIVYTNKFRSYGY